jgi:raffinose/stachyose/melibiose transport system permease protein
MSIDVTSRRRTGPMEILLLGVYALLIIVPLLVVVFGAFKSQGDLFGSPLGPPRPSKATVGAFREVGSSMGRPFRNSVIVTACSVTLTIFFASLVAFAIARLPRVPSAVLLAFFTIGMAVPAQVNVFQQYALFKDWSLLDKWYTLILANTAATLPVAVFILAGFMKTLPKELFEAATVDGASPWRLYRTVVMPLSLPSVAAVSIFLLVMHWNDLLHPLIFLPTRDDLWTLPRALVGLRGEYLTNYPVLFAGLLLASAPIVAAYVFLQRWFIAGMTSGAVKG